MTGKQRMDRAYYVRVDDLAQRRPYTVYEGPSRRAAAQALDHVERTLYGIAATAAATHNLNGRPEVQEWIDGCPPDNSRMSAAGAAPKENK